jgi:hypothetical protein
MKQYVIDELRPKDYELVKAHLEENFSTSDVDGIYWIQLDQNILSKILISLILPYCTLFVHINSIF